MADVNKITATVRTEFGKGAARRARRDKMIPVVLYGHGAETRHLSLPSHETFLALKGNANALVELVIDGEAQLALSKAVQRDPVRRTIDHVDFVAVRRGEKVTVDVPVSTEGETAPGTIHMVEMQSLTLTAPATSIPEVITVSVEGLEDGAVVRIGDLDLPQGVTLDIDEEAPVVVVTVPRVTEEDLAADEAAAEAGAEAGADAGNAPVEGEGDSEE